MLLKTKVSKDKSNAEISEKSKSEIWSLEKIKLELSKLNERNESKPGEVLSRLGCPSSENATAGLGSPEVTPGGVFVPVSYTHLTLPTKRIV